MKISRIGKLKALASTIITGCLISAAFIAINVDPATAREDNRHQDKRGNQRYEQNRQSNNRYHYERGRRVYHPYGYRERMYRPPPVLYAPAPPPPPGIGIFFPPLFIHL